MIFPPVFQQDVQPGLGLVCNTHLCHLFVVKYTYVCDNSQETVDSSEYANCGRSSLVAFSDLIYAIHIYCDIYVRNSRNVSCVCTTRVLHMFTKADWLIVNHGHSYIDYVCAMCFWEHVEMYVIVSGAAIWVYATNYLIEQVSDEWNRRPVREEFWRMGIIMLSLIGYKLNEQTIKESTSTLIKRYLDRRYLLWESVDYCISYLHMKTVKIGKFHILELIISGFLDLWLHTCLSLLLFLET